MRLMTGAANGGSYEARAPVHHIQLAVNIKKAGYVIASMSARGRLSCADAILSKAWE